MNNSNDSNNVYDFNLCKNFLKGKNNASGSGGENSQCPFYYDLDSKIKFLSDKITQTQWTLSILITIFGLIVPLAINAHIHATDKIIETSTNETNSKYELILQELKNQKENNQMQIQRDVALQVKKIK